MVESDQFLHGTRQRCLDLFHFTIKMTELESIFFDVLFQVDELILVDAPVLLLLLQQGGIPHLLMPQL